MPNIDEFTRGFLVAALWSSNDESRDDGGDPLDKNYTIEDFDPTCLENLARECAQFESDKDRYTAWLAESIVWTIVRIRAGDNREAIRGLLQASDYCGRIGGYWPTTHLGDAFIALRNHFEDALRK